MKTQGLCSRWIEKFTKRTCPSNGRSEKFMKRTCPSNGRSKNLPKGHVSQTGDLEVCYEDITAKSEISQNARSTYRPNWRPNKFAEPTCPSNGRSKRSCQNGMSAKHEIEKLANRQLLTGAVGNSASRLEVPAKATNWKSVAKGRLEKRLSRFVGGPKTKAFVISDHSNLRGRRGLANLLPHAPSNTSRQVPTR